ncbi:MAG: V-type ATP synthase subunit I [Alistipes sp.]|nr:V-type ATP synthase subunit I [Alistipes sp.]
MMKYNIVLFSAERERFIERLRELGMVDITTSGWEPTEADRELITAIESRTKALAALEQFAASEEYTAEAPKIESGKVFESYQSALATIAAAKSESTRLEKIFDEWKAWGDFDCSILAKLAENGLVLRYFTAQRSTFEKNSEEWGKTLNIVVIGEGDATVRFVVIGDGSEEIAIDAQEQKAPTMNTSEIEAQIEQNAATVKAQNMVLSAVVDAREEIESELAALKCQMQDVRIEATADKAAEGLLLVMEGWAEKATSEKVDAMLNEYPSVVYIKENPTPEDNTPVKLKNGPFSRLFELIGGLYALPKYGTVDLTPIFAPFYMLFFAICLNDVGYGSILFLAGLGLLFKGGAGMKTASKLTMICGGASALFGLYTGGLFGMSIPELMGYVGETVDGVTVYPGYPLPYLDFQSSFFSMSMIIGVVQILIGMLINIVHTSYVFGVKNALGSIGWFLLLVSSCLVPVAGMFGIEWYTFSSPVYYACAGTGLFFMLILNRPSFNIFANFASGLWDTYNNVAGLLSDVLSYIRLFAIGLSGGVLAQVFNSLATGMTGLNNGIEEFGVGTVFQILGAVVILFIGHAINLFMSAISSFVHPMRLTFVEFYKNAGFEMTTREFKPLKKENN